MSLAKKIKCTLVNFLEVILKKLFNLLLNLLFTFSQKLESLLPSRPEREIPTGEDVEEVDLVEFDESRGGRRRNRDAYNEDDEDEEGGHGPRVQCAHQ